MSLVDNVLSMMKLTDEEYDEYDDFEEDDNKSEPTEIRKTRFVSVIKNSNIQRMQVCSIRPKNIEDGKEIIETLLDGHVVVLNMEHVDAKIMQRLIDFTLGATFAIDGAYEKINDFVYVVVPQNIQINNENKNI